MRVLKMSIFPRLIHKSNANPIKTLDEIILRNLVNLKFYNFKNKSNYKQKIILHRGTYRHNTNNNKNSMILTKRREQCLHGNLKYM